MKRYRSVSPPRRKKCVIDISSNNKKINKNNHFNKKSNKYSQHYDSDDIENVDYSDDIIYDDEFTEYYGKYDKPKQNNNLFIMIIIFFILKYILDN